jgi:hypothetical protein
MEILLPFKACGLLHLLRIEMEIEIEESQVLTDYFLQRGLVEKVTGFSAI